MSLADIQAAFAIVWMGIRSWWGRPLMSLAGNTFTFGHIFAFFFTFTIAEMLVYMHGKGGED